MPNWVQTKLTFHGKSERVSELLKTIRSEKDGDIRYFDFEKIIPMPESLKITSGSSKKRSVGRKNKIKKII